MPRACHRCHPPACGTEQATQRYENAYPPTSLGAHGPQVTPRVMRSPKQNVSSKPSDLLVGMVSSNAETDSGRVRATGLVFLAACQLRGLSQHRAFLSS